jgi:hypothetical protein
MSISQVKTILGLGPTAGVYTTIPDPSGYPGFVYTDGATFQLLGIAGVQDSLGLGTLALKDISDFSILSLVAGTADGNLVTLRRDQHPPGPERLTAHQPPNPQVRPRGRAAGAGHKRRHLQRRQ